MTNTSIYAFDAVYDTSGILKSCLIRAISHQGQCPKNRIIRNKSGYFAHVFSDDPEYLKVLRKAECMRKAKRKRSAFIKKYREA